MLKKTDTITNIETVENGWIVHHNTAPHNGTLGKTFVFDSPKKLAKHIREWGHLVKELPMVAKVPCPTANG